MIDPKLFPFFRKLDKNNSKAWFNPHKAAYKEMRTPFEEGLDELAVAVAELQVTLGAATRVPWWLLLINSPFLAIQEPR